MKISQLTTGQAADTLLRIASLSSTITGDKELMDTIGQAIDTKEMNLNDRGVTGELIKQWSNFIRLMLTNHRTDLFGILAAVNGKSEEEIEAQPVRDTLQQIEEIRDDEDLVRFLSSVMRLDRKGPSAPSYTATD